MAKSKMEASVEAVERAMSALQEGEQKDNDVLKEWLAEARTNCEEAKVKHEPVCTQIAELL